MAVGRHWSLRSSEATLPYLYLEALVLAAMCHGLCLSSADHISFSVQAGSLARIGLLTSSLILTMCFVWYTSVLHIADSPSGAWSLQGFFRKILTDQLFDSPIVISGPHEHVRFYFGDCRPTSVCEIH